MIFSSKKAMSPLIATVLLIAFAVALGAMIMNWSAGIESDDSPTSVESVDCGGISITTTQGACYSDNTINFLIKNDGKNKVDGVEIMVKSETSDYDITLKDSAMIATETMDKTIPFLYSGGDIELKFIPLVKSGSDFGSCDANGFIQKDLPSC